MKAVTLNFPDNLDINTNEVAMLVASKLYEQSRLSLGQAAELAKISKRAFIELLGNYEVSVFNYPAAHLLSDVSNA